MFCWVRSFQETRVGQLGSLMILFAIAAVGYLIWWAIKNDDAGDTGETIGLLAMRDHGRVDEAGELIEPAESDVMSKAEAEDRKKRPWLYRD